VNREQLAHVLRSACKIADDVDVLVIGSQSILGSFDEDELPREATASQEADILFLNDPDGRKANDVDVAIGEWSAFHTQFGIYAEGVDIKTAILPEGWRDRLVVGWDVRASKPARPRFLERHDLAVAKLAAGRDKDKDFVLALIQAGLLDASVIRNRAPMIPVETNQRLERIERIEAWLDHYGDAGSLKTV
jgi:hypothetical protein